MSLFGSLFTGVSALGAQSQSIAIISNNIANVNTTAFKRSEATFQSLVTTQAGASLFSPGTVAAERIQRVDAQGPIQQTSSSSDVSITGNGFFAVKQDADDDQQFLFTRNGQFFEDSTGLLKNTAGYFLYGWELDADGNLPASQADLSSLTEVNVAFLGGLTRPTSSAELAINLDADENEYLNDLFTTASTLPIPDTNAAHFTRGLRVFDSLGSAQDISFEFRKTTGPMANAVTQALGMELDDDIVAEFTGIAAGSSFDITVVDTNTGTTTQEYIIGAAAGAGQVRVDTVQDLLTQINTVFGGGSVLEARLNSDGRIVFQTSDPTGELEMTDVTNSPLSAVSTLNIAPEADTANEFSSVSGLSLTDNIVATIGAIDDSDEIRITLDGVNLDLTVTAGAAVAANDEVQTIGDYIDAINGDNGYTGLAGLTASLTSSGRIQLVKTTATDTLTIADLVGTPISGDEDSLNFATFLFQPEADIDGTYDSNSAYPSQGTFPDFQDAATPNTQGWWEVTVKHPDGSALTQGLINFDTDGALNASADGEGEIDIALNNIDWGNGSSLQDIEVDISRFSQFAGEYNVIFSDQNGAELGLRTGLEIDREGFVIARFSNGAATPLYKLPLVTFANENGLTELSGSAYTESGQSGEENLNEAGSGGAGFLEPSTLEGSNVDLADEFSRMIVTQRAFSAGTRVITVVDELTEELLRLR